MSKSVNPAAKPQAKKPQTKKPQRGATFVEQMSQLRGASKSKQEDLSEKKKEAHAKTRLTGKPLVRPRADRENTNFSQQKRAKPTETTDPFAPAPVTFAQQMRYRNKLK